MSQRPSRSLVMKSGSSEQAPLSWSHRPSLIEVDPGADEVRPTAVESVVDIGRAIGRFPLASRTGWKTAAISGWWKTSISTDRATRGRIESFEASPPLGGMLRLGSRTSQASRRRPKCSRQEHKQHAGSADERGLAENAKNTPRAGWLVGRHRVALQSEGPKTLSRF